MRKSYSHRNSADPKLISRSRLNGTPAHFAFWVFLALFSGGKILHAEADAEGVKFFETKIRPILTNYCIDCHGADSQESDLRVDSYAGILHGGASGPLIVPGAIDDSLLISVIQHIDGGLKMPPDQKMPVAEIELLKEWISRGAPHPDSQAESSGMQPRRGKIDYDEARQFWAFRPIQRPSVPEHVENNWVKNPIDAFVLQKLNENQLVPAGPTDKRTLIRRATFDLTGLPPSAEEVAAFVADESPEAYEKLIDRLLASPHYGEHWGRHWLDVARYADSNGLDENVVFIDAWRYRDYVVNSFNADKPYDRFVLEQLAGDILYKQEKLKEKSDGTWEPIDDDFQSLIATGFLAVGPKVIAEKDPVKMEMDIIDEQIDTIGQAMLGLTIACARCHDHKFDPISADDYYAIAGILKSTTTMQSLTVVAKYNEHLIVSRAERAEHLALQQNIATQEAELAQLIATATQDYRTAHQLTADAAVPENVEELFSEESKGKLAELRTKIKDLQAQIVPESTAMGVKEGTPTDLRIHVRGSHLALGRLVNRGVPEIMKYDGDLRVAPGTSGRLEFAKWIASPLNPLTSRVIVNRIWRWHFGQAIVSTTDNFGRIGSTPSNPELLDWLATEFTRQGWSFKQMHKLIMLSNTYQLSSHSIAENELHDLENNFHWRANVQRLSAEELRDSLLVVSKKFDPTMGGTQMHMKKWDYIFDHTSKDNTSYENGLRSIYQPVIRNNLFDVFALFDYSSADVPLGSREVSTVAPQALYMMNSPLVINSAIALTKQLLDQNEPEVVAITRLYEIALSRPPTEIEIHRFIQALDLLERLVEPTEAGVTPRQEAWNAAVQSLLGSNEFMYLN